jgi:colicin import membrane protein
MLDFIKVHWKYLFGAVLLHVLFAGIFALTAITLPHEVQQPQLAIEAVVVDPSVIARAGRKQQQEREREQAKAREAAEALKAEQRQQQEELARKEAEQKAEQEREIEIKRREQEALQRKQEEQVMLERKEAERKREAEAETERQRQRQVETERQRQIEAERKQVVEIERRQKEEAERRKQAEEARSRAASEDELRKQLEEEEGLMQARASGALSQYMAMIQQHVERRWIRPPSARSGIECEVKVAQGPSGTVLSVSIGRCNGDQAVQQSIETAVQRASPLPLPKDQRLFERNLVFIFRPAE